VETDIPAITNDLTDISQTLYGVKQRGEIPDCDTPGQTQAFQGQDLRKANGECFRINICHGTAGGGPGRYKWNKITVGRANQLPGHTEYNHNSYDGVGKLPDYFPNSSVPNPNGAGKYYGRLDEFCNFIPHPCEPPETMEVQSCIDGFNCCDGIGLGTGLGENCYPEQVNSLSSGENCQRSFAYDEDIGMDGGTCFHDWGINGNNNWGWTLGPLSPGHSKTYQIFSGATGCDITRGTHVGDLCVEYAEDGSTVRIQAIMKDAFSMEESNFYVGSEALPRDSNTALLTVALDQFTHIQESFDDQSRELSTYEVDGGDIYISYHATVCDALPKLVDDCQCVCATKTPPPTPVPTLAPTEVPAEFCIDVEKISQTQTCTYDVEANDIFNYVAGNRTHVSFETFHRVMSRGRPVPTVNYIATSFRQYDEEACDKVVYAKWEEANAYDAECVDGVAVIEFYAMYGRFHKTRDMAQPPDVCNDYCGCTGRKCGWRFTVPCLEDATLTGYCVDDGSSFNTNEKDTPVPTASGPTASPTICIEAQNVTAVETDYLSTLGSSSESIPITMGTIISGERTSFTVNDKAISEDDIPAMAIMYLSETGLACDKYTGTEQEFTARCRDEADMTQATIFIGDTTEGTLLTEYDNSGVHPACADALAGTSQLAAYFYDIPCSDPCDETEAANPAPPKDGTPSASPSLSPSPTYGSYCVEIEDQSEEQTCDYSADFVEHVGSNGTHVTFDLLQLFTDENGSVDWIAAYYPEHESASCAKLTSVANTGSAVEQITAECGSNGWTEVQVFVHGSAETTSGGSIQAPYVCNAVDFAVGLDAPSGHTCGFTVKIPCIEQLDETCTGTATPSSAPTYISTFTSSSDNMTRPPTPVETSSPTGPSPRQPEEECICIESGDEHVTEECHNLKIGEHEIAGTVCIETVEGAEKFQITYTASTDWTLLTAEFWIGEDLSAIPMDGTELDSENFPYFYCNSTGEDTWVFKFENKWSYNCLNMDTFTLSSVGQATVAKIDNTTGEIDEDTETITFAHEYGNGDENYFSWFDVKLDCLCVDICEEKPSPNETTYATPTSEICIETENEERKECHNVLARDDLPAGTVCVEISNDSEYLEVHFEAGSDWTLVTTEFWVGDDITFVPMADNELDTESFPYFWCNSTGQESHYTKVDLKWSYLCEDRADFNLALVTQVTLAKKNDNGEVIEDTELISFASEYQVDQLYGWFDVKVVCECPPENVVTMAEAENCITSKTVASEATVATLDSSSRTSTLTYSPIPTESETVTLAFAFHEFGDYELEDTLLININSVEIDLGALADYNAETNPTNSQSGTASSDTAVIWSREYIIGAGDSTDNIHSVTITLPGSYFADGTLTAEVELVSSQQGKIADLTVTANGKWCDGRRLGYAAADMPCDKDVVISKEDFESGKAEHWENGVVAVNDKFGHFLGRLGRENALVSKVFDVPTKAGSVDVKFNVYNIGSSAWKISDEFHVKVGIADVALGDFNQASEGSTQGITWSRVVDSADPTKHTVNMEISREYYLTGKLSLALEVVTEETIAKKSAGVDNFVITALGVNACDGSDILSSASGFKVSSFNGAAESTVGDDEEEDGRGYCRSEDFPCGEEEGMVNVCHYSITSGYQTYCLKESDSDLVRTYPDDYCGPCTGGYGSTMNTRTVDP